MSRDEVETPCSNGTASFVFFVMTTSVEADLARLSVMMANSFKEVAAL